MKHFLFFLFFIFAFGFVFSQSLVEQGKLCFEKGDYACAVLHYSKAINSTSGKENQIAQIMLDRAKTNNEQLSKANVLFKNSDFAAARECYQYVVASNSKDEYAKSQLSICNEKLSPDDQRLQITNVEFSGEHKSGFTTEGVSGVLFTDVIELKPTLIVNSLLNDKRNVLLKFKIINPEGKLVINSSSSNDYTCEHYIILASKSDNLQYNLPHFKNLGENAFNIPGQYKCEIWCNGRMLFNANFIVQKLVKKSSNRQTISESIQQPNNQNNDQKTISGYVYDHRGRPVIGASVVMRGTTIGTIADINGKFSLPYQECTLVISYVGKISKYVIVNSSTPNPGNLRIYLQNSSYRNTSLNFHGGIEVSGYALPAYLLKVGFQLNRFIISGKYITNFSQIKPSFTADVSGFVGDVMPFYSGKISCSHVMYGGGLEYLLTTKNRNRSFARQLLPYTIYLGAGKEKNEIFWETTDHNWVYNKDLSLNMLKYQGALRFRFFNVLNIIPTINFNNDLNDFQFTLEATLGFALNL